MEFALASFTALFVTVNPIKVAALFPAFTEGATGAERRSIAMRATLVATVMLLIFALFGDDVLRIIGISLQGVRVGGGVLLLLLSIDIVFGHPIAPPSAGGGESEVDLSVFPLATPMIAGPGAITATIVQATEARNAVVLVAMLIVTILVVMLITLGSLLASSAVEQRLGHTGTTVITRVLGILLAAVSAEMILTGIRESGLFHS
jgi:multiple antibiotic resistance protein